MTTDPGEMERLQVGDDVIEFADSGHGNAILLVHGGVFSDWFATVAASPELDGFRVIRVRRAGYVAGSPPSGHLTLNAHAAHCALLLADLGIDSALVCGHSSGALIALELARYRPDAVQSMVLLEPAPGADLVGPTCRAALPDVLGPVMAAFAKGESANAFDQFLRAVGGPHYQSILDATLGVDGYERALQQSTFFFSDEVSAVQEWAFGPQEAARIGRPTLVVEGGETASVAAIPPETVEILAEWMPNAKRTVLSGTTHLMPLESPAAVARLVAEFARGQRPCS